MIMPGTLHMQVLRSPHAHARILSIDTSAAENLPGVHCVITVDDVPGEDGFGVFVHDQPIMARGVVRYVSEAVTVVAANDVTTARRALNLIKVEYEELPAVFDAGEVMKDGAPVIHDYAADNIVKYIPVRKGDVAEGFAAAHVIIEDKFGTQAVEHAYLKPEAGIGYVDNDDVVTIVGGKEDMIYQGMLALAALKAGQPVRLVFTREESIATTAKRHPSRVTYRMGFTEDGKITAAEFRMISGGGAYGLSTEGVMRKAAILSYGTV